MNYSKAFEALGYELKNPRQEWSSLSRSGVCISLWSKELATRNRLPWIDTSIHARPLGDWGDKPGNHLRIAHLIVALTKFDGFVDVVLVSGTPGGSYDDANPWHSESRGGRWRVIRLDEETGHFEAEVVPTFAMSDSRLSPSRRSDLATLAAAAKAWPFEQARLVVERLKKTPRDDAVVFETGYGPSGLPHIGTFGEVVRTSMVRHAFRVLTDDKVPSKIICVSDDMDGMRKIPDNIPNADKLVPFMQRPLTDVPDPFGTHESFAHHNNARLRSFLDSFGFEYEFKSATELYKSGVFDQTLLKALSVYDEIMAIMLPTLGEERRRTYSPFLPISPKTGRVLYVPMKRIDAAAGTITFDDEDGEETTQPVTGGRAKMQWKPDFGMRWAALGVDFEMFGKDHQPNQQIYARICKALGAEPPINFVYELFLDQKGEKISKTKGNGISVEDWLKYASPESLSLYNFQKPRVAKKLYFDVIPKAVDEYISYVDGYHRQNLAAQLENPAWHIHAGHPPNDLTPISFALLMNLVSAANAETKDLLWAFIGKYAPGVTPQTHPFLDKLTDYAIAYFNDFVKPTKRFRAASDKERAAFEDLIRRLDALPADTHDGEVIQNEVYAVGKEHGFEPLRDWFKALYEVLFGVESGPRFGQFAAIFGVRETAALMRRGLAGELMR